MFHQTSRCKVPETHVIISAKNCKKNVFLQIAQTHETILMKRHFIGRKRRWGSGIQDIPSALDFIQSSVNPGLLGRFKTRRNLWAAPLNNAKLLPWMSKLLNFFRSNFFFFLDIQQQCVWIIVCLLQLWMTVIVLEGEAESSVILRKTRDSEP